MSASAESRRGSCLCGRVTFEVRGRPLAMGHCHCSICRRQHGTAYSTYVQVAADALVVTGGADRIRSHASSEHARRSFCSCCGTRLFYRSKGAPADVWIAAGAFDDDPGVVPAHHIFVASGAPWFEITDDLPRHDAFPAGGEH